ncbi:hypothetical protein J6590_031439 [Homalodisca vitripennis]|nr:hypothetical protein J6590_031439 [Homalodisca vitripennis]
MTPPRNSVNFTPHRGKVNALAVTLTDCSTVEELGGRVVCVCKLSRCYPTLFAPRCENCDCCCDLFLIRD